MGPAGLTQDSNLYYVFPTSRNELMMERKTSTTLSNLASPKFGPAVVMKD